MGFAGGAPAYQICRRWHGVILCGSLWVSQAGRLRKTIDFIFLHGEGNWGSIVWLGLASLAFCVLQFGFGRWLGGRYGDKISGGQLLGQKNTAMGIWMAGYYLTPLASVFLAFYSVFQNVWNSWQMWQVRNEKQNGNDNEDKNGKR